jgi:hypothetical protein
MIGLAEANWQTTTTGHQRHLWLVSPRLGVRFELNEELEIYTPAGELFLSPLEISQKAEAAQLESVRQQIKADAAEQKAASMAAKLRELGLDPDTI